MENKLLTLLENDATLTPEQLSKMLEKLAVYAFLKNDDDGKNAESVKNYALVNDFYSKVNEETAFARPELSTLEVDFLKDMQKSEGFEDYDRVIEDIIRYKKHTLSEKEEKNIATISGFSNTDDVFSVLSNIAETLYPWFSNS